MKRILVFLVGGLVWTVAISRGTGPDEVEADARALLARMTLEEKVGQLVQYSSRKDMTGPAGGAELAPAIAGGGVGSLLNIAGAEETRKWQKYAVESSRLHVPLLIGLDVIHGFRTVFPIPLASAASWEPERIEAAERIAATEMAAAGINWTFAPMVDIARDPRWGRISEGAGEDPYLGSLIAAARVRGFQGRDLAAADTVLACAKHFAAYGAAQAGRDYDTTDVSENTLREVYLPPFRAAVDAGVGTLMAGFNDLDGTPCTANRFLLRTVLRDEWGFRGFVVSDWASIEELQAHGLAADLRGAGRMAFAAGLDVDMQSEAYAKFLAGLVKSGAVSEERLDEAAGAVLRAKFRLGLFDDPYRYSDEERERTAMLRPAARVAARELAARSCVLLKNEGGTLPIEAGGRRVALIGPLADAPAQQLGAWRGAGRGEEAVSVRTALEQLYGSIGYARGCGTTDGDRSGFAAAVAVAKAADVIVAAMGEGADQSGEANSRSSLNLSGAQTALLRELRATGKPVVLLLMTGRPLVIEDEEPLADAILLAWHPGTMGGPAIADVLSGACNPAGHLPVTWPRSVGQLPVFYAHKNSGRPVARTGESRYYSHYIDLPNTPRYVFGHGLSYTSFTYDELKLSTERMTAEGSVVVSVRMRNTGKREGEDVVQLYARDRVGSLTRPVRELKGFRKVGLRPGESQSVEFTLRPADLAFWRADGTFGPEPGDFDVFVGDDSDATLTAAFRLVGE